MNPLNQLIEDNKTMARLRALIESQFMSESELQAEIARLEEKLKLNLVKEDQSDAI